MKVLWTLAYVVGAAIAFLAVVVGLILLGGHWAYAAVREGISQAKPWVPFARCALCWIGATLAIVFGGAMIKFGARNL